MIWLGTSNSGSWGMTRPPAESLKSGQGGRSTLSTVKGSPVVRVSFHSLPPSSSALPSLLLLLLLPLLWCCNSWIPLTSCLVRFNTSMRPWKESYTTESCSLSLSLRVAAWCATMWWNRNISIHTLVITHSLRIVYPCSFLVRRRVAAATRWEALCSRIAGRRKIASGRPQRSPAPAPVDSQSSWSCPRTTSCASPDRTAWPEC